MAVTRWDPWGELASLQRDVSELFGRSGVAAGGPAGRGLVPPIDAFHTEDGMVVRMELPGMSPDEVDVSVQDNMLTVSGERRLPADVADDDWIRRERPVGQFQRSFSLTEGTDPNQIAASFEHGVLELRVPHPPERKPHRIQVADSSSDREAIDVG